MHGELGMENNKVEFIPRPSVPGDDHSQESTFLVQPPSTLLKPTKEKMRKVYGLMTMGPNHEITT